jgi:polar amino acid transport system permease protein
VGAALGYTLNVQISPFLAGMIALGLVFAGYSSEVLLGAFRALDRGQIEAGQSLGLRPLPLFLKVTMPQILRFALPGLGNTWLVLLKDTSLVSVIALEDLLRQSYLAAGQTKQPFVFYAAACVLYLLLTILSSAALIGFERHLNRGWRAER